MSNNIIPPAPDLTPEEAHAQEEIFRLAEQVKTATLATLNRNGSPEASYAPYIQDEEGHLYVYVSALSKHTSNLKRTGEASLMLIEDEASAADLHARRRATWTCTAEPIERHSEFYESIMTALHERFGATVEVLSGMKDFTLFQLRPQSGRLVIGFGKAFRLQGWHVQSHLRGRHQTEKQD